MSPSEDIQFEIVRPTVFNGWIVCYLTLAGVRRQVLASDASPPFWGLLNFLHSIRTGDLPDHTWWDEEGRGANLEAWAIPDRPDRVRLRVTYNCPQETWVDAEFDAEALMRAFIGPLRELASWNIPAREHLSWNLNETDIDVCEGRLPEGVQPPFPFRSRGPYPDYSSCHWDADEDPLPAGEMPVDGPEEDQDQAGGYPTHLPGTSIPFPTPEQLGNMMLEYLKSGHHLGPVDEWTPPEDIEDLLKPPT